MHLSKNIFLVTNLIILIILTIVTNSICQENFIRTNDGLKIKLKVNYLQLHIINDNIIQVQCYPVITKNLRKSLVVVNPKIKNVNWNIKQEKDFVILNTTSLHAKINKTSGNIIFTDSKGNIIIQETKRDLTPAVVLDEKTYNINQQFQLSDIEALYGLGQHQDSIMNWRGKSLELHQLNMNVSIPFIVSSKGYGILWDNYSLTKFSDNEKGMDLWSEVGDGIDYYLISGNNIDEVISGYRNLTGQAPLFGKWGYGFIQSKERYNTQNEIISTLEEFRKREIPIDVIVQDWFYWNPKPWGSHYFDINRYPHPSEMTDKIHKLNGKIMISVWAKFDSTSTNYEELNSRGLLFKPIKNQVTPPITKFYDAYNPKGRKLYWRQMRDSFYVKGFDAWWLDATEPEITNSWTNEDKRAMNNYLGTGARYFNTYPLMTTTSVYQGQRNETSDKRVFILTRSAFAGQQRNAAVTWSGDITAGWNVFRKQISAGLNFCYSGIPYWTTDIGGFFVNISGGCKDSSYKELFTRWYQFGAFCPIFRVHGTSTPRELWQFGEKGSWAYDVQLKYDQLRYRLMPYIYSTAWKVTHENYTMMRGLAFDFPHDKKVLNIDDEYMFGNAFLVNPVTNYMYYKWVNANPGKLIHSHNFYDTNEKQGGLTAEYYSRINLSKLFTTRIDSCIDFNFNTDAPIQGMPADSFSIRWTGKVLAEETGNYNFSTLADDGTRLWVDGKLIIDDWNAHAPETHNGTIALEKGKLYDIKLEYFDNIFGATVRLSWLPPSQQVKNDIALPEKSRDVYLPQNSGWTDFWSGKPFNGGQTIKASAPIDIMPLFIKQGSIIPMGPFLQYANEKPADPIELRIYPGADGSFTLYEDENDNYNYEKGVYATIDFKWNNANKTLTISNRKGKCPGMIKERSFNIVLVKENFGTGLEICTKPDRTVKYDGSKIDIKF